MKTENNYHEYTVCRHLLQMPNKKGWEVECHSTMLWFAYTQTKQDADKIVDALESHAALLSQNEKLASELVALSERMWQRDYVERAEHDSSKDGAKDFANSRPWYISARAALSPLKP